MNRLPLLILALAMFAMTGSVARSQSLQRITVYVQNPTSGAINFSYRKGGDEWVKHKIQSGYTMTMTGIAPHLINFDNARGKRVQYSLRSGTTNYFQWSGGSLDLKHR